MSTAESQMDALVRATVLDEIYRSCDAAGITPKFKEHIELVKKGDLSWEIVNDWTISDKWGTHTIAKYLEHGTTDHWIEPRFAKALAWPHSPGTGRPQAIYSRGAGKKAGQTVFSRGHYVRGIRELAPMRNGFRIGVARLKAELRQGVGTVPHREVPLSPA